MPQINATEAFPTHSLPIRCPSDFHPMYDHFDLGTQADEP